MTEERAFDLEDVVSADLVEEYARHADADAEELRQAAAAFQSIRVQARKAE